jgi:hypothetical protein
LRLHLPVLVLLISLPVPLLARPTDPNLSIPLLEDSGENEPGRSAGISSLSTSLFSDTVYYGGTYWATDSLRWEALRDSVWTFDSGVGSAFGPTGPGKPAGYHTRMEGWFGIDQTVSALPYFRRSTTCAISGSYSFWAGITAAEAVPLCWAAGQGYGNSWELIARKTYFYPGSGTVSFGFAYATDCEPGFDFFYVTVDTLGTDRYWNHVQIKDLTGITSGTYTTTLTRGVSLPSTARNFTINFVFAADGSYSDEDGFYASLCGGAVFDNVTLTGAIADASDFETGPNGWAQYFPVSLYTGGDFSNIVNRAELPPSMTFCGCGVRDSVLVFFDELDGHTRYQDNIAVSPWIDLKRNNDVGRAGRVISYDIYAELPIASYVFVQLRARWYPFLCTANGKVIRSPFRDQNTLFWYGDPPFCTSPGAPRLRDYSSVIGPEAEQVQIAVGVINLCSGIWEQPPYCTDITNTTPWFDNIRLGVYGPREAPIVSILSQDYLQDNFAEDGTLNPSSTGRLDASRLKNTSTPGPTSILGDTLVARGNGGNTEVRLVFRVRPGPFTSMLALGIWSYQWTPEPGIGAGWYSARMDTAEQGGAPSLGAWMATFHESDPGFFGTDRSPDPNDPWQLENEILPDRILTPGSRVDYFVASRYIPPDPRNPTGTAWYVAPDTTGGRYAEVEILPSSFAADTTWNAVLYVDHHNDRELSQQALEEQGLNAALGAGGANAEGTRYDRFDVQAPSSNQVSFGRPSGARHGASLAQTYAYQTIVWHSGGLAGGTLSSQLTIQDAAVLSPWLTTACTGPGCPPYPNRRFWGSGDGLASSMYGNVTVRSFMENVLGVLRTCDTVRDANCPNPSALDSTFCLPLATTTGAEFITTTLTSVRGNGCPDVRSFDVLSPNPAVASAKGQIEYLKSGFAVGLAGVTNVVSSSCARTVLDGFAVGVARTRPVDPHQPLQCGNTGASLARTADVLGWLNTPCAITAVVEPGIGGPHYRTLLDAARPNPMGLSTRISFTVGLTAGPLRLEIFDVTGRLVKTLVNGNLAPGPQEIPWDGTNAVGVPVASGLYFYRLSEGARYGSAKKLIVMR